MENHRTVLIVMGSESDALVMRSAADLLRSFDVACELHVSSAHRAPDATIEFARTARERGVGVIIAGAGLAAHLPGVIAACTTLPVIGVPLRSGPLAGADALHAIVQMPRGVPVATVAIDGAHNAGLLAVQVLAVYDEQLAARLAEHKEQLAVGVAEADARLQALLAAESASDLALTDVATLSARPSTTTDTGAAR